LTISALRALDDIPPFPQVAVKALQVISRENEQLRSLSELIATDAAISGEVLRIVNSALFGARIEVTGILQAIHMLGLERIKAIVLTIAMKSYLGAHLEDAALRACWRHGLACALVAQRIARSNLMEADMAYTAGLLHDVGRLALIATYPVEYAALLTDLKQHPGNAMEREKDMFGMDHCAAGLEVIARWNLPAMFAAVVSLHHTSPAPESPLLSAIRLACRTADAIGFNAVPVDVPVSYDELLEEMR
jgi:HD-like signal output (HDOD) protein